MKTSIKLLSGAALVVALPQSAPLSATQPAPMSATQAASPTADTARCAAIATAMAAAWPDRSTKVLSAAHRAAGPISAPPGPPGFTMPPMNVPAHCEVIGTMQERIGIDGQTYAIKFHVRLPDQWNGRFLMEGGGGLNGNLGMAVGMLGFGAPTALAQGYAVVSQDSGHDSKTNNNAERGGEAAFGFDPQARANYGGASLKPVALAAKALVKDYYGKGPQFSYFVGCSKGGQEGMMLAQRYPDLFDGISAGAPGFSLPRAAIAEAWNTKAFAGIPRAAGQPITLASVASSFSDSDFKLVGQAILAACDKDDGLADGIVSAFGLCTSNKVLPELARVTCKGGKDESCLSQAQVDALRKVHDGPRNSKGEALYASFPWDAGWSGMGWRVWSIGSPDGRMPAANIAMGAPALATVFSAPPTTISGGLQGHLDYIVNYDFDREAPKIYATNAQFPRSGWQDVGARSPDLNAFRARGGKLIVPHGVSDSVFSINDTVAWWDEVNQRQNGQAAEFVRVFPVPGMAHCTGGPATDQYDTFRALVNWVEKGTAPDRLDAAAGPMSPWPGRTRPLCPYPLVARFEPSTGQNSERASAFVCAKATDNLPVAVERG